MSQRCASNGSATFSPVSSILLMCALKYSSFQKKWLFALRSSRRTEGRDLLLTVDKLHFVRILGIDSYVR